MSKMKTIALAAGGTGGHMFPAESLAQEMKRRGWQVILFTDARGLRFGDTFPADHIIELKAANPNARGFFAKMSAGLALAKGLQQARQAMRRHQPDIAVGFGGYPSAPAMVAARNLKIPYGVHEQNAVLGRVNRLVANKARFIAHGFEQLSRLPSTAAQIIPLGNPVRDAVKAIANRPFIPPAEFSAMTVLIFGGSQGASLFSRIVPEAIIALPESIRKKICVVQQVRDSETQAVRDTYESVGIRPELAPFFADLPEKMSEAHLVIGRAGASTVTEIAVIGRPAILVPLGIAMDDHQTGNAKVLVEAGGACLIAESDFTVATLRDHLAEILGSSQGLAEMAVNARKAAPENAVGKLADLVEKTVL